MGDFPNKSTQFSSENQPAIPGGVFKKGSKHISTWIQEFMNDEEFELLLSHPLNGVEKFKGAPIKAIVKTAMMKAANGDKQWADWLANNGWGSKLQLSNDPENPLTPTAPVDPALAVKWQEFLEQQSKDATA
jgi:hypothetical protein